MTLSQDDLLRYAEQGVKARLQAIQAELNELAVHFPQIVATFTHPESREPTMLATPNGRIVEPVPQVRIRARAGQRQRALAAFLATHPGATTREIATELHITPTRAQRLASQVGRGINAATRAGRTPMRWKLKAKQPDR